MGRTKTSSVAEQIQESAHTPILREKKEINPRNLYPTGSTMLNLACSDHHRGGFDLGTIVTMPGASAGGKTMLAMTALAEGIHDKRFDEYEFVFDDAEAALNFDMPYLFGQKVIDTLAQPPLGMSTTVQDFKANCLTLLKQQKKSCIYVLDSLDSLSSDEELEKEMRKALALAKSREAADKIAGSFGMEKAKIMHQTLRMINAEIEATNSILIILQQLKQRTNAQPFQNPWTTTGGEGPFFYSTHQIWLSRGAAIKSNKIEIGGNTLANVAKNKLTGKRRKVNFSIYDDYGVDNIGSILDWLIEHEFVKKKGTEYDLHEFDIRGTRPKTTGAAGTLIEQIEEQGLELELNKYVGQCWHEVEERLRLCRKPKFGQ